MSEENNNVIPFPSNDYKQKAVDKIAEELKNFHGDRYAEAVKNHVASTLTHFCEENARFAEIVYKTKRTLSDCCASIMKGCGSSISDIDVYRGAVKHYFPNSDITFTMSIAINGDAPSEEEMNKVPDKPKQKERSTTQRQEVAVAKAAGTHTQPSPIVNRSDKQKPVKAPETQKDNTKAPKKEYIQLSLF